MTGVPDFYRKLWGLGEAGIEVQLQLSRRGEAVEVTVTSGDRYDYLQMRRSY